MPSTITVKDALRRVCVLLQDMVPQFTRWTETELVDWLGDAQLAIVKFMPMACYRVDALKLKPGTLQSIELILAADCKPGDGSTQTVNVYGVQVVDVLCSMGSDGLTPGRAIRLIPNGREILDATNPMWHTLTDAAPGGFMFDPRMPKHFMLTAGIPVAGTSWARVAYTAQPVAIPNTGTAGAELYKADGASTTKLSIADEFLDDLVNYVCARAYMKNASFAGNAAKAAEFTSLFTGSINAKVTALTGTNPNLRALPMAAPTAS